VIPIITVIVIIILIFSIKYIVHNVTHESSDNAQIDGNIIPMRIKAGGYIVDIRFGENQLVKKGDTLAIVDTIDIKAQVEQAEARLESALIAVQTNQTGKQSATFSTEAAEENISSAKAKLWQAESDFNRIESMYKKGAATPQTYDAAKSGLDMAKAQYKALTAQKATAGTQITAQNFQIQMAEARVKEAKAQLVSSRYLLDNCYIIAPCNGIVSKKSVEKGQLCLAGTAIAMLIDLDNLWVTANLKETQLDNINHGAVVNISIDAYPEIEMTGEVESIAGATGPKFALLPADNATGNFVKVTQRVPVRIAIKHTKNEKKQQLVPGMNVVVDIKTNK
jgi:membrane fusion protein (multidrug efflux system)